MFLVVHRGTQSTHLRKSCSKKLYSGLAFLPFGLIAFAAVDLLVEEVVLEDLALAVLLAIVAAAVVGLGDAH